MRVCVGEKERDPATQRDGVETHISVQSSTYRPNAVKNNHSLFAHGCQGVWFPYICHDDVHL